VQKEKNKKKKKEKKNQRTKNTSPSSNSSTGSSEQTNKQNNVQTQSTYIVPLTRHTLQLFFSYCSFFLFLSPYDSRYSVSTIT
jgi:hypothetical protein